MSLNGIHLSVGHVFLKLRKPYILSLDSNISPKLKNPSEFL